MADTRADVIRMYDGALRAIDTKAQIFIAFLTLTLSPVFQRLADMNFPMWVRGIEAAIFVASAGAFVYCLYPRRGRRATQALFDTSMTGDAIVASLAQSDNTHDCGPSLATLHDIFCIKTASVRVGTLLLGLYLVTVAVIFAIA